MVDVATALPRFDNSFTRELEGLFKRWRAVGASEPRLLELNEGLARDLGADPAALRSPEGVDVLVGNATPDGADPVAQAYAGHQFGGFSPRLGDGRALLVGEIVAAEGRRVDLHLKGTGRTPFARGGDGLAPVGPMLREYVMCEAMHALGIPTTRALAVVATGDRVVRETELEGAVLARVASSHLRVGTFQYAATLGEPTLLAALVDHAIARHHPAAADERNPPLALFDAVAEAQASLVARWMAVGFVHGVMNTDNTTISGETIDYGPCAFMDAHDPATVFSSIDHGGRYAYGNQPAIVRWNLARLAEAMLGVIDDDQERAVATLTERLDRFGDRYREHWVGRMSAKLGLAGIPDDAALLDDLVALLADQRVDHTSFFRSLSTHVRGDADPTLALLDDPLPFERWVRRWDEAREQDARDDVAVAAAMDQVNPVYVPRNHLVEEALTAGVAGDLAPFRQLNEVLARPFSERPGLERFARPAPDGFTAGYRTFCGT
ncbi:protein adenylyltransferase SelO [Ilumatobacter sp.]|uniref:protein adenylyltransferase SelO n=1 Tax=Ilumatobacter sp. TaxID=1967498 RepID=UPI003B52E05F